MGSSTEITILFTEDEVPPQGLKVGLHHINLNRLDESLSLQIGAMIQDALRKEYPNIFRASVGIRVVAHLINEEGG